MRATLVWPAATISKLLAMLASASDGGGATIACGVSNTIHTVSPRRNTAAGVSASNGKAMRTVLPTVVTTGVTTPRVVG